MDSEKLIPTAASSSRSRRPSVTTWRIILPVLFFGVFLYTVVSLRSTPATSAATPIDVAPPAYAILREACHLRFWKLRALPYCERATATSWTEGEEQEAERAPLEVFQVHTPPRATAKLLVGTPEERAAVAAKGSGEKKEDCRSVLMQHTFGWSYGKPFIGEYTPPRDCEWKNVIFKLTMTSKGRQFDRLGHLYLGDIEVWRTSTAEPTWFGIVSSYSKDMTHLTALLRQPQKIIFDLGNLVNDVYTGSFNVTLTATYYSPAPLSPLQPADVILPISARRSGQDQPSHFFLPQEKAISTPVIPANAIRVVASISASGNADEEFWYTNVPNEYTHTFPDNGLSGHGPFRELQLLIDGSLAGFVWPAITVFTGGIVPSLWRPIVAPGSFDLPEYEIDISPFLPVLLDGQNHTIELAMFTHSSTAAGKISRSLGNDWLVSARLHIWTDPVPSWKTTGTLHQHYTSDLAIYMNPQLVQDPNNGSNSTLLLTHRAARNVIAVSTLTTSAGNTTSTWIQGAHYDSLMRLTAGGNIQFVSTSTSGSETTAHHGARSYRHHPFILETTFIPSKDYFALEATIRLGESTAGDGKWTDGVAIGSGGKMGTVVEGNAKWRSNGGAEGTTEQVFAELRGLRDTEAVASYGRRVVATGGEVVEDWEKINGVPVAGMSVQWKRMTGDSGMEF